MDAECYYTTAHSLLYTLERLFQEAVRAVLSLMALREIRHAVDCSANLDRTHIKAEDAGLAAS